jgi:hypothetical protein
MAPPQEVSVETQICIGSLRLERFSASSTSIGAGEQSVLQWSVNARGCSNPQLFTLFLNDARVPLSGARTVRPSRPVSYGLAARGVGIARVLGRVRIDVDDTGCEPTELPEAVVAPLIVNSVRESVDDYNNDPGTDHNVGLRRETVAEIEPDGIVIRLRMTLKINNFFNPDIDVDARLGVGVSPENEALVFYRSFHVDVDWPWWVTGITGGISKIVEEFIDDMVEGKLRNKIRNDLRAEINSFIQSSGGVVSTIETEQDRVVVTVCS